MDTGTGIIYTLEEMKEKLKQSPDRAKFMKWIPDEYVQKMQGMNRAERRKFYREHKKDFK